MMTRVRRARSVAPMQRLLPSIVRSDRNEHHHGVAQQLATVVLMLFPNPPRRLVLLSLAVVEHISDRRQARYRALRRSQLRRSLLTGAVLGGLAAATSKTRTALSR